MTEAEEILKLKGELHSAKQMVESYRKDAASYLHSFEIEESRAKEVVQKEMAAIRAENSLLKEEIARLKRLRHAARDYANSVGLVFKEE